MRKLFVRLTDSVRRFMYGRYGNDKLNMAILTAGVVAGFLTMFLHIPLLNGILILVSYALMIWAIFRCFSRNTYKRYQENRKYLLWLDRIKDRQHKYFSCPRCRQPVRVPRGKGKISIKCPNCGEKFIRKS